MSFEQKDLMAVAKLARLRVSESEALELSKDLAKILDYVAKLSELDTSDVPPTAQLSVQEAPTRPDIIKTGVDKAAAFKSAPRSNDVGFLVPTFVDEG